MQNLNALFGVAYQEIQRFSVPQLGYLSYRLVVWQVKPTSESRTTRIKI